MNVSRLLVLLGALGLAVAACGGPVSATRVDRRTVQHDLARSALTTGDPSWPTRNVLFERGLFDAFDARPEATLADLHRSMVAASGDPDVLFALAELAYLYGQAAAKPEYQLAAAVYAYAFLFPEGAGAQPGRFDPRLRLAADLYNWGLATGFASAEGSEVVPRGGVFALPFGRMEVAFDEAALRIGQREMHRFIPTAELEVDGLAMRYRRPGLGTPLAASTRPVDGPGANPDLMAPRLKVPVTALLRIPGARQVPVQERPLTATLELHLACEAESVSIGGEQVPIENEPSAALAYTFTGVPIVQLDPEGKDPGLRRMVLIGHSQGGLLVKMQAISSGSRLWDSAFSKPLADLTLSDSTRDLLQSPCPRYLAWCSSAPRTAGVSSPRPRSSPTSFARW